MIDTLTDKDVKGDDEPSGGSIDDPDTIAVFESKEFLINFIDERPLPPLGFVKKNRRRS